MNKRRIRKSTMDKLNLEQMTDLQMQSLIVIINKYIEHARHAEASSRWAARSDESDCFRNNARYWRNGIGVLRWVRGHLQRSITAHVRRRAEPTDSQAGDRQ